MIDKGHPKLSVSKQCSLLLVKRASYYYKPNTESDLNLKLMDKHYLQHPEKRARRMHLWLTKDMGYQVSLNRVERLNYRVMGLHSLMPGPHTTKRNKDAKIYPVKRGQNT
jgi:putative transposase